MSPDDHTIAVERRFDVAINIDKDWFRSYVKELAKYHGGIADDVDCNVRIGIDFDDCITFSSVQAWADYVTSHWDNVAETNIWPRGRVRRASCNHRLHQILIRVKGRDASDIETTFKSLSGALSLSDSAKVPYRYRRSSLEFEIGNWRPDAFVQGVKGVASILGSDPDVREAYAKSFEGDIEKLTPFFDLKSFCQSVGTKASRFGEVVIRMQSRSIGVGIAATSDHKKLRVRTTLPPDELDKLIAAWPEEMKLKSIKATDTGADVGGSASIPPESRGLKYGIPVVVALITALSTSGLVSLTKAVLPDYKVVVTSPVISDGVARWSGDVVPIEWYLQPDQPSFRTAKKDVVAEVRLHTSSGALIPLNAKPPVRVRLNRGIYVVVIDAPGAPPTEFQLIVGETSLEHPEQQRR